MSSTLQSESAEANCPSNKAASRWLSVQEELKKKCSTDQQDILKMSLTDIVPKYSKS